MSFGRHRKISEEKIVFQQKIIQDTKEFAESIQIEIDKTGPDLLHPKEVSVLANTDTSLKASSAPDEVKAEEIKKVPPKKRKNRVDKKEYTNIGVIGSTVVCKEFRAIVKKKGLQINNVLTDILHQWNTANYNL